MKTRQEFAVSGEYDEGRLIDALADDYAVVKDRSQTERLTFFDTFDWRLFKNSLLLYQSGGELVLRSLSTTAILHRQAIEGPVRFVWDLPDGALKTRLEPVIEMRALLALTGVNLRSTLYRILNNDEKTVVRLTYEALEPAGQSDEPASTAHLYLKPVRGYDKHAGNLQCRLETMGLRADQKDLLVKALAAGERTPGDYSTKLDMRLKPRMRADEATKIILRRLLRVMKSNEAGIDQDIDTEFLHDFRVAVRRTRSALSQIKGVFPEEIMLRFKRDLAYIGKLTNDLRDLDVYLLAEEAYKAKLPPTLGSDIDPLFDYLKQKRLAALQQVRADLASKKYAQILQDWEAFLNEPLTQSPTTAIGSAPIIDLARRRIYKKYRRVVKWGRRILKNTEDEQLHALRIECKKLRYLMEFFATLFPAKEISRLVKQLKKLQTNLGDFNDLCVQEDYLLHIAAEMPLTDAESSRKLFLATGCLIGVLHQQRVRVKADFARTFANFDKPANEKRFKNLFRSKKQEALS